MNDVPKHCKRCKHDHATGILRYDSQNVPLYGARPCVHRVTFLDKKKRKRWRQCGCKKFKEDIGRFELEQEARRNASLPVVKNMNTDEVAKMYAETGYLSPQTPLESRVALYKLWQLPNKVEREREFQRLIAMVTMDTRAAFLRTDNKFANFVAQMDHILLAMQNVEQLNQRLASMDSTISRILDVLKLHGEEDNTCAQCGFERELHPEGGGHEFVERATAIEAAHVFASKSAPLWNEPIAVEADDIQGSTTRP